MKAKAPLAMMEQIIMVLVFALAAAICLRAFVWAGDLSRQTDAESQALLRAESAAEVLKSCHGDYAAAVSLLGGTWQGGSWQISYDENWEPGGDAYRLILEPEEDKQDNLGAARVTVSDRKSRELAAFVVGWQEVDGYA